MTEQKNALLKLLIGSIIISTAPVFIKLADVGPDAAGFWRMLFSSTSLIIWLTLTRSGFKLPGKAAKYALFGGVALGLDFMCWHRSIDLIGPGLSTLLGNFQIFFTALISWWFFKETISRSFVIAVGLAVIGLVCITGIDIDALSRNVWLGLALGLGTAFFYSLLIIALQKSVSVPGTDNRASMLTISFCCMLWMAAATGANDASFVIPDIGSLGALLGAGVLCSTFAWALISNAMRTLPATLTGLVLLLQPALAMVWDVLLFDRPTGVMEVIGVLLMLCGIHIGTRRKQ